jgi:hypothetical protein
MHKRLFGLRSVSLVIADLGRVFYTLVRFALESDSNGAQIGCWLCTFQSEWTSSICILVKVAFHGLFADLG